MTMIIIDYSPPQSVAVTERTWLRPSAADSGRLFEITPRCNHRGHDGDADDDEDSDDDEDGVDVFGDGKYQSKIWILQQSVYIHYETGLSLFNNWIREIVRFAPIFQGNNCFRVNYLDISFTFDIDFVFI